jgi:hypothetical protein
MYVFGIVAFNSRQTKKVALTKRLKTMFVETSLQIADEFFITKSFQDLPTNVRE